MNSVDQWVSILTRRITWWGLPNPTPGTSESIALGWVLRICISIKFLDVAAAAS